MFGFFKKKPENPPTKNQVKLCNQLGLDPMEVRLKNASHEGTKASYGPKWPRIGLVETLEDAKAHEMLAQHQFPPGSMGPKIRAAIVYGKAWILSMEVAARKNNGLRTSPTVGYVSVFYWMEYRGVSNFKQHKHQEQKCTC